jgi:hypothetical protein
MKKGINNWDYNIQWIDDNLYDHLNGSDKKKLNKLRSLDTYIKKLQGSIDENEKLVKKLSEEINNRKKKIKGHQKVGREIFEYIEKLKSEFEVKVYYTEGKNTKGTKKIYENTFTGKKEYKQVNLKYKTKGGSLKTINLGTTRSNLLSEIKKVDPKWYSNIGLSLGSSQSSSIKKVRNEFSKLFKPLIENILKKNYIKIQENKFKLTKDILFIELKKKK